MVATIALLSCALTACTQQSLDEAATPPAPDPFADADTTAVSLVLETLRAVPRAPTVAPYRRDAFGRSWTDVDGNGCNQRDDVLLRDALPGTATTQRQGRCDHDVLAGEWIDPYTGKQLVFTDLKDPRQAQGVQIDHVVPLAEAWVSGAAEWDDRRRLEFANDLPGLVASDGPTNASKSSHDPAAWRPRQPHQCDYARRWIAVKQRWDLGADASERRALTEMLNLC
ncbi:HNH endonuclease family protein [Nocardioides alcanivorans]|uniref:HNH endonuclease family protein n=1 Tax=Nocardioides alcanivorans TaxID=2897352 RepID=UPI001F287BBA|nr:HNH endonuclease family protein [Nocardioides alcanivorans]